MAQSPRPGLIGPQPLPAAGLPMVLPGGEPEPLWHRFFQSMQERSGGAQGVDSAALWTQVQGQADLQSAAGALEALGAELSPADSGVEDFLLWLDPPAEPEADPWGVAMVMADLPASA